MSSSVYSLFVDFVLCVFNVSNHDYPLFTPKCNMEERTTLIRDLHNTSEDAMNS